MKINIFRLIFVLTVLSLIAGCIPQNKLEYLQDPITEQKLYELQSTVPDVIKPNDELYIKVSSFDDISFNFFDTQSDYARTAFNNELALSLVSYTVNDTGNIYFPILGTLHVEGETLEELRSKMETQLADFFNQPTVIVKYAYKKVTVIGEVQTPGNFTYSKKHINLFEALSMAGDMTVHGNRKEVYLLRQKDGKIQKNIIDLTSDALIFSNYYFLEPDDVIYVKPRSSVKWRDISTPISLILSTLSTTLLAINLIYTMNNNSSQ
ncbi:MAG: polysaccharide biosynthesis/export family protein [Bacteroidales bacterium]|nr:polysaccharide biosynthesis/export family protein [Bacteroidales bacterium]